mmetsp:Transcript_83006/g.173786  ORF Transcript_83006/g.173786 Transcript_83006/m.173786 type:complete len:300 (+) Transcript_83006:178-1077(+)
MIWNFSSQLQIGRGSLSTCALLLLVLAPDGVVHTAADLLTALAAEVATKPSLHALVSLRLIHGPIQDLSRLRRLISFSQQGVTLGVCILQQSLLGILLPLPSIVQIQDLRAVLECQSGEGHAVRGGGLRVVLVGRPHRHHRLLGLPRLSSPDPLHVTMSSGIELLDLFRIGHVENRPTACAAQVVVCLRLGSLADEVHRPLLRGVGAVEHGDLPCAAPNNQLVQRLRPSELGRHLLAEVDSGHVFELLCLPDPHSAVARASLLGRSSCNDPSAAGRCGQAGLFTAAMEVIEGFHRPLCI